MRIKIKPRFIISMSIIFILGFSFFNGVFGVVFSHQEPIYEKVIVAKGDTLWSIAQTIDGNINENIFEIKKLNNLNDSDIYVGQELLIPVIFK